MNNKIKSFIFSLLSPVVMVLLVQAVVLYILYTTPLYLISIVTFGFLVVLFQLASPAVFYVIISKWLGYKLFQPGDLITADPNNAFADNPYIIGSKNRLYKKELVDIAKNLNELDVTSPVVTDYIVNNRLSDHNFGLRKYVKIPKPEDVLLVLEKEEYKINLGMYFFNPGNPKISKVKVLYNESVFWADPRVYKKLKI